MTRPDRARGFSLVELMIGLLVGLLLTVGLVRIFVSSKQGYRVQESSSRMQENLRFALEAIGRELRHADFWGAVKTDTILPRPGAIGTACSETWHTNYVQGLIGYEGASTAAALNMNGCTVGSYIRDSDVLAVRYADPNAPVTDADVGPASATGYFFRSLMGRSGYLFTPATKVTARETVGLTETAASGVFEYRYRSNVLSLGVPTTGPRIPTLYICSIDRRCGFGSNPEALVEGIEQMQFAYGLDTDADRVADRFRPASEITTDADWAQVITVKVGLILRGDTADGFLDTTTYELPGGFEYTPSDDASTPEDDRSFQRRVIVKDFQVRNRTRS